MTIRTIIPAALTRSKIEGIVRDSCPIKAADLAAALNMSPITLSRHVRALKNCGRVHRVKPSGCRAPAGGIWAPGPEPRAVSSLEQHFFGRAAANEVRL